MYTCHTDEDTLVLFLTIKKYVRSNFSHLLWNNYGLKVDHAPSPTCDLKVGQAPSPTCDRKVGQAPSRIPTGVSSGYSRNTSIITSITVVQSWQILLPKSTICTRSLMGAPPPMCQWYCLMIAHKRPWSLISKSLWYTHDFECYYIFKNQTSNSGFDQDGCVNAYRNKLNATYVPRTLHNVAVALVPLTDTLIALVQHGRTSSHPTDSHVSLIRPQFVPIECFIDHFPGTLGHVYVLNIVWILFTNLHIVSCHDYGNDAGSPTDGHIQTTPHYFWPICEFISLRHILWEISFY